MTNAAIATLVTKTAFLIGLRSVLVIFPVRRSIREILVRCGSRYLRLDREIFDGSDAATVLLRRELELLL